MVDDKPSPPPEPEKEEDAYTNELLELIDRSLNELRQLIDETRGLINQLPPNLRANYEIRLAEQLKLDELLKKLETSVRRRELKGKQAATRQRVKDLEALTKKLKEEHAQLKEEKKRLLQELQQAKQEKKELRQRFLEEFARKYIQILEAEWGSRIQGLPAPKRIMDNFQRQLKKIVMEEEPKKWSELITALIQSTVEELDKKADEIIQKQPSRKAVRRAGVGVGVGVGVGGGGGELLSREEFAQIVRETVRYILGQMAAEREEIEKRAASEFGIGGVGGGRSEAGWIWTGGGLPFKKRPTLPLPREEIPQSIDELAGKRIIIKLPLMPDNLMERIKIISKITHLARDYQRDYFRQFYNHVVLVTKIRRLKKQIGGVPVPVSPHLLPDQTIIGMITGFEAQGNRYTYRIQTKMGEVYYVEIGEGEISIFARSD
ncbi:MAG: hypothetical protein QXF17_01390 [Ignisphaera sp.]